MLELNCGDPWNIAVGRESMDAGESEVHIGCPQKAQEQNPSPSQKNLALL
jgi:hypothetical protein